MVDHEFKVLIIGDQKTGKTEFMTRCAKNQYVGGDVYCPTVGIDFSVKDVKVDGKNCKVQLWDTAGNERYQTIVRAYYNGASGMIIAYDITNKATFDKVGEYIKSVHDICPNARIVLIGTKCDLSEERTVNTDTAQKFAEDNNIGYFETSSKDNTNIEESFTWLLKNMVEDMTPPEPEPEEPKAEPEEPKTEPEPSKPAEAKPSKPADPVTPPSTNDDNRGIVSLFSQFKVPLIILLAASAIYVFNKYLFKSPS